MTDTAQEVIRWFREFGFDAMALIASLLIILGYYSYLSYHSRRNPSNSIHYVNELARKLWVEQIMRNTANGLMAVQTLRNFIMVGILMVSTSTILIIGTLTLSGQAENLSNNWHTLSLGSSNTAQLWIVKVLFLLTDFMIVLFSFVMSIRLANQVLFMINVAPESQNVHIALSPEYVARRLNRAGQFHAIGIRSFLFAIPLVFWLFGPLFLLLATSGLMIAFSRIDRHDDGF